MEKHASIILKAINVDDGRRPSDSTSLDVDQFQEHMQKTKKNKHKKSSKNESEKSSKKNNKKSSKKRHKQKSEKSSRKSSKITSKKEEEATGVLREPRISGLRQKEKQTAIILLKAINVDDGRRPSDSSLDVCRHGVDQFQEHTPKTKKKHKKSSKNESEKSSKKNNKKSLKKKHKKKSENKSSRKSSKIISKKEEEATGVLHEPTPSGLRQKEKQTVILKTINVIDNGRSPSDSLHVGQFHGLKSSNKNSKKSPKKKENKKNSEMSSKKSSKQSSQKSIH
jgi:hypothetical protein